MPHRTSPVYNVNELSAKLIQDQLGDRNRGFWSYKKCEFELALRDSLNHCLYLVHSPSAAITKNGIFRQYLPTTIFYTWALFSRIPALETATSYSLLCWHTQHGNRRWNLDLLQSFVVLVTKPSRMIGINQLIMEITKLLLKMVII